MQVKIAISAKTLIARNAFLKNLGLALTGLFVTYGAVFVQTVAIFKPSEGYISQVVFNLFPPHLQNGRNRPNSRFHLLIFLQKDAIGKRAR